MCTGLEIAAVVAVAQAATQQVGNAQSVVAANRAAGANKVAAVSSAANQYRSQIMRYLQEEEAATVEIAKVERDAMRAQSGAALAAIESGAGGGALADKVREFRAEELRYRSAVSRNLGFARGATALNMQAVGLEAANRSVNYRPEYTEPNLLAAGLSLTQAYLDAQRFNAPKETP